MQKPDLSKLDAAYWGVTLSTGRTISLADVRYDVGANRFYYGGADVTQFLTYAQRLTFPSFDIVRTNAEASDAKRGTGATGSTSTIANFLSGVGDDAVGIAGGIRKFFAGDPENPGASSDLRKVLYVVAAGAGLFLVWKIIQAWRAK